MKYVEPRKIELNDRTITTFMYTDKSCVERVDYQDGRKKELFPKFKNGNVWKWGASSFFGMFNEKYLNSSGTLLIAEGEKCADLISRMGLLCVSPPMFGWNHGYLTNFFVHPLIHNIIFLPDNDEPGKKKANMVIDATNCVKKASLIFPTDEWMTDEDVFDLHTRGIDVKSMIEEYGKRISTVSGRIDCTSK
jgi:hypothetical protein